MKPKVLFLCTGNSFKKQSPVAQMGKMDKFEVEGAGFELNPEAIGQILILCDTMHAEHNLHLAQGKLSCFAGPNGRDRDG